jgi:uncharacterized protein YgiB involved in biofilm formation
MKKSTAVPLLLLGSTALLAGCTPDYPEPQQLQETRQDAYATLQECDRDWDDDECERSGGVYLGPRYFYSHGSRIPYVIDRKGRTRAMPSNYGAYNSHRADASGAPAIVPGRSTIVTRNDLASSRSASIARGGFGGGRSRGSFGG